MTPKPPSLALRAVLALVLMVGFYLLALAIAAGLLYIPYAEMKYAERLHARLAVGCVLGAGAILWSVLPRIDRFVAPWPRLHAAQHPRLFRELEDIARATGQAMPAEVYLLPEVNAWVAHRGGIMGFGGRRVMGLGLPLLQVLTVDELRGVLAHEFGHYDGGDVALGPWVYKTRAAIIRTVSNLAGRLVQKPFLWYGKLFLRITHAVSRWQEYAADALAARVVGAAAMRSGLRATHAAAPAFDSYWRNEVAPLLASGYRPPIGSGFAAFMAAADVERATADIVARELAEGRRDPYDTHPSLKDRLAALQGGGAAAAPAAARHDGPAAIGLLEDTDALEAALLQSLAAEPGRPAPRRIEWQDALEAVFLPAWTGHVRRHAAGLAGITLGQLPALVQQPAALVARFAASLDAHMPDDERGPAVAVILGAAVAVALHRRGLPVSSRVGHPVEVRCGETTLQPFSLAADLAAGRLTAAQWEALCAAHGLGELALGSV